MTIKGLESHLAFGHAAILTALLFLLVLFSLRPEVRGEVSERTIGPQTEEGQDPILQAGRASQAPPAGSAASGEALFVGRVPLRNGGPSCASCHSISGIPFPNGGRLGPDLSGAYERFGSEGTDFVLETLFFPTMAPIFADRPLTAAEQRDLKAFLRQTRSGTSVRVITLFIFSIAILGSLALMILIWILWRHRLTAVRKPLLPNSLNTRGPRS